MIEMDITKLHWNPDTCGCEIEITKETTRRTGYQEFPSDELPMGKGARAELVRSRGGILVYRLPTHETVKVNVAGEVLFRKTHGPFETAPPSGDRLRGTVVRPCADHVDFKGVVQTQWGWCPGVCRCLWQELWIGERKELGFFGYYMERICPDHKELPPTEIRGVIHALATEKALAENPLTPEEIAELAEIKRLAGA